MALFGAAALSADDIAATAETPARLDRWRPGEAALIAAVDAIHEQAELNEQEFSDLRRHFDDDQTLEVLMLAGFYRTVAYIANSLKLPLEAFGARFPDWTNREAEAFSRLFE